MGAAAMALWFAALCFGFSRLATMAVQGGFMRTEKASVVSLVIGGMLLPFSLAVKLLFQIGIPFATEVVTQTKLDAPAPSTAVPILEAREKTL